MPTVPSTYDAYRGRWDTTSSRQPVDETITALDNNRSIKHGPVHLYIVYDSTDKPDYVSCSNVGIAIELLDELSNEQMTIPTLHASCDNLRKNGIPACTRTDTNTNAIAYNKNAHEQQLKEARAGAREKAERLHGIGFKMTHSFLTGIVASRHLAFPNLPLTTW